MYGAGGNPYVLPNGEVYIPPMILGEPTVLHAKLDYSTAVGGAYGGDRGVGELFLRQFAEQCQKMAAIAEVSPKLPPPGCDEQQYEQPEVGDLEEGEWFEHVIERDQQDTVPSGPPPSYSSAGPDWLDELDARYEAIYAPKAQSPPRPARRSSTIFSDRVPRRRSTRKPDAWSDFQESHIVIQPLGTGSNGAAFLALSKDDIDDAWRLFQRHRNEQRLCDYLRDFLVVAKFALTNAEDGFEPDKDMQNEIRFLQSSLLTRTDVGRSLYAPLIDSKNEKGCRWLTLSYVSGGTLDQFVRRCWQDLNISMIWHIGLQIARALAFFHFGSTTHNIIPANKWPPQMCKDLHSGNILMRPKENGMAPEIALIDFGRAERYPDITHAKSLRAFIEDRNDDYYLFGRILEGMLIASKVGRASPSCRHCTCRVGCRCPIVDCVDCIRCAKNSGILPKLSASERLLMDCAVKLKSTVAMIDEVAMAGLQNFMSTARKERSDAARRVLPESMRAQLARQAISDSELLSLVQDLAKEAGVAW